jgi:HEAT repeat protein
VFVSYDRDDRDFAEVVQAKLERAGHKTAMDFDLLRAGDDWQDKLDVAIRGADAIVVIMSPEARASEYVAYEWAFALGAGVKVIPLELRTTPFPARLDGLHRLEFTGKNRPWDTLLAEVALAEAGRRTANAADDPDTPPAVRQAVRAIDSLVPEERRAAIETLAQTDHPAALAALTRALEHPVKDVRAAAARMFPDRANPKIVPGTIDGYLSEVGAWVDNGRPGDAPQPRALFECAGRLGAVAVPALLEAMTQLPAEPARRFVLRETLLRALGRTKAAEAAPALQEAIADSDPLVRWTAAEALGELEYPAAAAALRARLDDSSEVVRRAAAEALGRLKDMASVDGLIDALANDTPYVASSAAEALGRIGDRAAVETLVAALADEHFPLKKAAAEALGRLGDTAAVPHLRPLLSTDPNGQITDLDMTVMTALVRLRDTASFEEVGNRLVDFRSGQYGGDVYNELAGCGDEGVQVLVRVLNGERRNSPRAEAAKALESVQTPAALNALRAWRRQRR